jgi:hypothetical protein
MIARARTEQERKGRGSPRCPSPSSSAPTGAGPRCCHAYCRCWECAGIPHDEYVYPAGHGRFDPVTGVPAICRVLAQLTGDPDALHDALAAEVPGWPRRPLAEHCRALFAGLAARFGRTAIVERTGTSSNLMPVLRQQFPEARYVFLHRDGPDSALSMSRHPGFRVVVMLAVAEAVASPSSSMPAEMLPAEIRAAGLGDFAGLIAPPFDAERFMTYPLPPAIFGWVWSSMTRMGTSEIREVPHDRWMTMRYERLVRYTRAELSRLAGFIGVPADPGWLDWASGFVDAARPGQAAARLHPSEIAGLRAACASGTRAFELLESEHAPAELAG